MDELAVTLAPDLRAQVDALCAATDAARALALLERLESEPALAEVAQHGANWEIRLAAAQRVTNPELLARILEGTRHRDNRVFRHCSDLLRARRRTLGHGMRAAELAAAYRRVLTAQSDDEPLPAEGIDELDAELSGLRQEFNVPQECLDLAASVRERLQRDAQALRDLGADAAEAEALCARIERAARPEDLEAWRAKIGQIAERSAQRVAWLADHPTSAALAHSMAKANAALEALTPAPQPAEPIPAAAPPRKAKAPTVVPAQPAVDRGAVRELLDRLALQIEGGQLAEAEETERQLLAVAGAGPLPESLMKRLRRERAQLGGMRDWAKWGDDQSREQLIRAGEELLQGTRDPEELATAVTGLREQWKKLDATRHAGRKQWERFDAVLTRAFKPVLEHRARRAGEEKLAAKAKASVCEQCETWIAGIDWEHADFRAIATQRHELAARWRGLKFAGFREERRLRKRFDQAIKAVDGRLDATRLTERSRREALIGEAEALREAAQLGDAIKAAVGLQAKWKDGALRVSLARQEEQVLWQRFRGACDAIFARRDAQRDAQAAERATRAAERAARDAERDRQQEERKAQALRRQEAARNRFEVLARDSALAAAQANPAQLDKGRIEREALLVDLELALDLPSPASAAGARRERQLLKLQERFRPGSTAPLDPEALVLRWYAAAARSDPEHDARMAVVVAALLKAGRQTAK